MVPKFFKSDETDINIICMCYSHPDKSGCYSNLNFVSELWSALTVLMR